MLRGNINVNRATSLVLGKRGSDHIKIDHQM
jgi:hypothetical protein